MTSALSFMTLVIYVFSLFPSAVWLAVYQFYWSQRISVLFHWFFSIIFLFSILFFSLNESNLTNSNFLNQYIWQQDIQNSVLMKNINVTKLPTCIKHWWRMKARRAPPKEHLQQIWGCNYLQLIMQVVSLFCFFVNCLGGKLQLSSCVQENITYRCGTECTGALEPARDPEICSQFFGKSTS